MPALVLNPGYHNQAFVCMGVLRACRTYSYTSIPARPSWLWHTGIQWLKLWTYQLFLHIPVTWETLVRDGSQTVGEAPRLHNSKTNIAINAANVTWDFATLTSVSKYRQDEFSILDFKDICLLLACSFSTWNPARASVQALFQCLMLKSCEIVRVVFQLSNRWSWFLTTTAHRQGVCWMCAPQLSQLLGD